jgi:hypothetical protein
MSIESTTIHRLLKENYKEKVRTCVGACSNSETTSELKAGFNLPAIFKM